MSNSASAPPQHGQHRYQHLSGSGLHLESAALQGWGGPGRLPGVAWLVVSPPLVTPLLTATTLADRHSGVIDQLTLAELIASGAYDRHIRRSRLVYRQRRDGLIAALGRDAPETRVSGIAAGLHAVVTLPPGRTEEDVIADAASRGLAVSGLANFGDSEARHAPALVVGYAKPPEHAFTAAVARLAAAVAGDRDTFADDRSFH